MMSIVYWSHLSLYVFVCAYMRSPSGNREHESLGALKGGPGCLSEV